MTVASPHSRPRVRDPLAPVRSTIADAWPPGPDLPALNGLAASLTAQRRPRPDATGVGAGRPPWSAGDGAGRPARRGQAALARHPARGGRAGLEVLLLLAGPAGRARLRRRPAGAPAAPGRHGRPLVVPPAVPDGRAAAVGRGRGAAERPARPAVRADSPPAARQVVPDEAALLAAMRASADGRAPGAVLDQIRDGLHLGRRTLWGSLASGVAHGLSRAADVVPGPTLDHRDRGAGRLGRGRPGRTQRAPERPTGLTVQRRTCCLAFTLPEPKICAGCCIR